MVRVNRRTPRAHFTFCGFRAQNNPQGCHYSSLTEAIRAAQRIYPTLKSAKRHNDNIHSRHPGDWPCHGPARPKLNAPMREQCFMSPTACWFDMVHQAPAIEWTTAFTRKWVKCDWCGTRMRPDGFATTGTGRILGAMVWVCAREGCGREVER